MKSSTSARAESFGNGCGQRRHFPKMKMAVWGNGHLTTALSLADSSASIILDQVPRV
jgi:hypothetical protein